LEHKGTVTLQTERLTLRRYSSADAEAMFDNWASDTEVTKYLRWQTHADVDVSKSVIESWVKQYPELDFYCWAITLKATDEPIGTISAGKLRDDIAMAEVGYCIGRKWWHQGYTSEALNALIHFFFEKVGINRLEARHDTRNPNSGKVMQKCGLQHEGTLRQAGFNNQGICDLAINAILAKDYFGDEALSGRLCYK